MKDVSVQIASAVTVYSKYAKHIPELNRRETWDEIVDRNCAMHVRRYPQLATEIREVYRDFVKTKKVLPSMRSLQFGGRPIELAPNRIFNCYYHPIDAVDAFAETMFLLLGGSGVGYSVQRRHTGVLPLLQGPSTETRRYVVGDSIEGWADAVKVLVEAYFYGKASPVFDFSDIRPKGAALITSGGKAPGPEPLRKCLLRLREVFDVALGQDGGGPVRLKPIEVHDAMCHIADAVLAGGIRRAAMICLFDRDDEEMLTCKGNLPINITRAEAQLDNHELFECDVTSTRNGKEYRSIILHQSQLDAWLDKGALPWYLFEPQRGRANNSAVLPRGEVSVEEFMALWQRVEESGAGEPGIFWTNDLDWGTNPCCEIGLRPHQFCNLTEINADDIVDQTDLNERAAAAAFIGTLQAGYTDFHYLRPIVKQTTEQDALIGVGMTGIGSGAVLGLDLACAARIVVLTNEWIAKIIGINPAARTTTIKPAGTSSLALGCSSGIHAWHNDFYLRRIRAGKNEALYQHLAKHHPELVVDDQASPHDRAIIELPQRAPAGAILRHESPAELLERVRLFNVEWVRTGHVDGANTHNVSCTISVKPGEWAEVGAWMWNNRNDYNGISVLPYDGGTYVQAPFEDITEEEYHRRMAHLTEVDLTKVVEVEDNTDLAGEVACAGGACEIR